MFEKVQEYDPGKFKEVVCKLPNLWLLLWKHASIKTKQLSSYANVIVHDNFVSIQLYHTLILPSYKIITN